MTDIKKYEPLWGSWYVDEQLGEGSFGKVYKVHKEEFGKTYDAAVKIISIPQNESDILQAKSEGLNDESAKSYFQAFVTDIIQEVDLMSALRGNSNIVSLEDHKVIEKQGEIGWDIIIRMELLETLSSHITKKPMTQAEVIKLGVHICRALEFCAANNTIHRDIKPDNIFVSPYGDYKLGDFGIARHIERTMSGLSKKGTYPYMAPEVFRGGEYGASVDTYSLGIVMYRFLNKNRAPFMPAFPEPITPHDREEALRRRMNGEKIPAIAGINDDLNFIVLKACAYDRNERFKSPTEMRLALEALPDFASDPSLSVPVVEIHEGEATALTEKSEEFSRTSTTADGTKFFNDTKTEGTQLIFSKNEIAPSEDNVIQEIEPETNISEKFIKKLAIFSGICWGLLALLTFFSINKQDILIFSSIYALCLSQCVVKFKNKALNLTMIIFLIFHLSYGILIDVRYFDYSFLFLTLCLLSMTASQKKIFSMIHCAAMLLVTAIITILIFNTSRDTHYEYVAGTIAIPFLTFLSAPSALLLGIFNDKNENEDEIQDSKKINFGMGLLMAVNLFCLIVFVFYATGLTRHVALLYYIINANFPGFSPSRFTWWHYGRLIGLLIQFFAVVSLSAIACAGISEKHFLYALNPENKSGIIKSSFIVIFIMIVWVILYSTYFNAPSI